MAETFINRNIQEFRSRMTGGGARSNLFEVEITFPDGLGINESLVSDKVPFLVICDESNNTPDVIDANEFKADIFIKPARSINFIGLTFVATRTGVSFSEVAGRV